MGKKSLYLLGAILLVVAAFSSCTSQPDRAVIDRYFHAIQLNDVTTMSTIAVAPTDIDFKSFQIAKLSETKVQPAPLPDMSKKEAELKKKLEDHVGPTLDAKDVLDIAKEDLDNARTKAAKVAAQKKVDDLQAKYDQEFEAHKQLQKDYNDAKSAAAREEEISIFSLGEKEVPNIRDLTGEVQFKETEVKVVTKAGAEKTYLFQLRLYNLKDETLNRMRRGRWVITDIKSIS
jgi:hypothetical protein